MAYLKYRMCQISINHDIFNLGTNLGLTGGKYLIKIIFHIKIEIGIFEISNVLNFNTLLALLILGPILAEQMVSITKNNF